MDTATSDFDEIDVPEDIPEGISEDWYASEEAPEISPEEPWGGVQQELDLFPSEPVSEPIGESFDAFRDFLIDSPGDTSFDVSSFEEISASGAAFEGIESWEPPAPELSPEF